MQLKFLNKKVIILMLILFLILVVSYAFYTGTKVDTKNKQKISVSSHAKKEKSFVCEKITNNMLANAIGSNSVRSQVSIANSYIEKTKIAQCKYVVKDDTKYDINTVTILLKQYATEVEAEEIFRSETQNINNPKLIKSLDSIFDQKNNKMAFVFEEYYGIINISTNTKNGLVPISIFNKIKKYIN